MDYITFPFEKFVSCITTEYDVQADSILALYIEIAKYLRDNPIVSGLTVKEIIDKYLEENPPAAGVVSVNGKTGAVTGLYDADNPPPYPVTSVNGKTGAVTGLYGAENPPPYPVTSVNGKTGVVTGLYDQNNQPPYPVTSVNGKTGIVTGLYDENNQPPYPVTSVNGITGDVRINILQNAVQYAPGAVVPAGFSLIFGIPILTSGSLPKGNTMYVTLITNRSGFTVLPVSCQTEIQGLIQCSCTIVENGIGMSFTSHAVEGGSSPFSARLYVYSDNEFTITNLGE